MFVLHERGATYENNRRFIISPCENMIRGNDNYKDLLRLYSSNQEKLLSTLTEEQKERYEKIHDCADELCNELEKQSFINGFNLCQNL